MTLMKKLLGAAASLALTAGLVWLSLSAAGAASAGIATGRMMR